VDSQAWASLHLEVQTVDARRAVASTPIQLRVAEIETRSAASARVIWSGRPRTSVPPRDVELDESCCPLKVHSP